MKNIPENVYPGARVKLAAFGFGIIKKVYAHHETGERCCDVRADTGEIMHLSLAYAQRVVV
jgi:hypothetical protein